MPKLRPAYDGRRIKKTTYEERKVFLALRIVRLQNHQIV